MYSRAAVDTVVRSNADVRAQPGHMAQTGYRGWMRTCTVRAAPRGSVPGLGSTDVSKLVFRLPGSEPGVSPPGSEFGVGAAADEGSAGLGDGLGDGLACGVLFARKPRSLRGRSKAQVKNACEPEREENCRPHGMRARRWANHGDRDGVWRTRSRSRSRPR